MSDFRLYYDYLIDLLSIRFNFAAAQVIASFFDELEEMVLGLHRVMPIVIDLGLESEVHLRADLLMLPHAYRLDIFKNHKHTMKEKKGHDGVITVFGSWIISNVKKDNYVVFVGTRDGWATSIHDSAERLQPEPITFTMKLNTESSDGKFLITLDDKIFPVDDSILFQKNSDLLELNGVCVIENSLLSSQVRSANMWSEIQNSWGADTLDSTIKISHIDSNELSRFDGNKNCESELEKMKANNYILESEINVLQKKFDAIKISKYNLARNTSKEIDRMSEILRARRLIM